MTRAGLRTTAAAALATAVAAGCLGGLAACGLNDGGTAAGAGSTTGPTAGGTPVRPSPTPTPSPTPAQASPRDVTQPPERPDALSAAGAAGAEAAARYFAELWPYASATGDTTEMAALSDPACTGCTDSLRRLADGAAAGQHAVGGAVDITWVKAFPLDAGGWTVDVDLDQEPYAMADATGAAAPGGTSATITYHLDIDVTHDADGWQVVSLASEAIAFSELPTTPPAP